MLKAGDGAELGTPGVFGAGSGGKGILFVGPEPTQHPRDQGLAPELQWVHGEKG